MKIKQDRRKKTKKKRNLVLKRTAWKVWACRSQTRLMDSYGWTTFCVWSWGFNSCNRWAGSQGNQRHQHVLKISIWKWKACYFMGKREGAVRYFSQLLFPHMCIMWGQPELCVHWENSSHSTCRLSVMGRLSELAGKKEEKAICTTSEAGQVFLALHSHLC